MVRSVDFEYKDSGKTMGFVDTPAIQRLRPDESYHNQLKSSDGWVGNLRVWEASNSSGSDYHNDMNAGMFEDYMGELFRSYEEKGHNKVVFCMDNVKHYWCESHPQGSPDDEASRTLSTLKKDRLIDRHMRMNADLKADDRTMLLKPPSYVMTQQGGKNKNKKRARKNGSCRDRTQPLRASVFICLVSKPSLGHLSWDLLTRG
ncbi:hypothetical protein EDD21DRAFT_348873 [Dissophora ornata]|nr:hypothetical protein EDD21DRAFT_348873 [Dissophora ornata]